MLFKFWYMNSISGGRTAIRHFGKLLLLQTALLLACKTPQKGVAFAATKQPTQAQKVVTFKIGATSDTVTGTQARLLLAGGSTDVEEAMRWFLQGAGGGDVVIIRASGADGYNAFLYNLAKVHSVETMVIDSREKAMLPEVAQKIRSAEALFIAGGDQWNYVNFWQNTPVQAAINHLLNTKKVPVGGTSAGLAILGGAYFNARYGTAQSAVCLQNPFDSTVSIGYNDFLTAPFLANCITDSHYSQRQRMGRHVVFMAHLLVQNGLPFVQGLGIDEKTAVGVDEKGLARVFGTSSAYFLRAGLPGVPETYQLGLPLQWNASGKAVDAHRIDGKANAIPSFNLAKWEPLAADSSYKVWVENGKLR
ncbi:MAG: cyanophycinase [Bacteroidetes bacterium]|nr:MAG: cyanophycinase [Bacteroidota bacterium]